MKKKFLVGLVSLVSIALVGCNSTTSSSVAHTSESTPAASSNTPANSSNTPAASSNTPTSSAAADAITSVSITNKDALTAEWHVNDATREIKLTIAPEGNIQSLILKGKIVVSSSDKTVVKADGLVLSALKAGTATITVAAGSVKDTVSITVLAELTAKEKYGTAHAGTEEDPLDNEDALKAAAGAVAASDVTEYYIKGVVESFYKAPGASSNGEVSFYLTPAEGKTEKFEVYKCYKDENQTPLTEDDIWVGATVTAKGALTYYASSKRYETTSAILVKTEGTKPEVHVIESTVANALTVIDGLKDNETTTDKYKITGYVTDVTDAYSTKYKNISFNIADTATGTDKLLVYRLGVTEEEAAKIKKGAKIQLTATLKKAVSTSGETSTTTKRTETSSDFSVLEEAPAVEPATEPEAVTISIADLNKLTKTDKSKKYTVTGVWEAGKGDDYGGGYLTDPTTGETIQVYGSTATASALGFDGSTGDPIFTFTNPKDAKTSLADLSNGQTVTMTALFSVYGSIKELQGVITSHVANTNKYTATAATADNGTISLSKTSDITYGEEITVTVTPNDGYKLKKLVVRNAQGTETDIMADKKFNATVVNTVEATFEDASTVATSAVLDFSTKAASHNNYMDEWTYDTYTICGGANNNGQWAFVKLGAKSATISADTYKGTYIKTPAMTSAVKTIDLKFVGQCFNQDNEKASVKVEEYSDSGFATKVSESAEQEVQAIAKNGDPVTMKFTAGENQWSANSYYKIVFNITNTTKYNGVVALESVTFSF